MEMLIAAAVGVLGAIVFLGALADWSIHEDCMLKARVTEAGRRREREAPPPVEDDEDDAEIYDARVVA